MAAGPSAVITRTPDGGSCLTRLVASSTRSRIHGGGAIAVARPSLAAVSRSPLTSSAQVGHCSRCFSNSSSSPPVSASTA